MAKSKRRGKKKEAAGVAAEVGTIRSAGAVRRSFAKATKELGQMLRGADALYRIPWFAMIGEPGCGKSDLLPDSGLSARPGSPSTFGLDPPGANEWWFFSDAVVIDFAAGYFDGGGQGAVAGGAPRRGVLRRMFGRKETAGGDAWKVALEALRENRRKRPLDGVILVVDVEALRSRTPEQVSQLSRRAEAMAERIQDAQFNLAVHFPVYVVLANCHHLSGFEAYARSLPEAMRDQMFGWSAPHEPDASYQPEWIDEAVGSLHESVCVGQLELLPQAQSQSERDEIYLLPRELSALVEPLKQYLDPIFKSGSFRKGVPLRGIYMTGRVDDEPREQVAGPPPLAGAAAAAPEGPSGPPRFVRQLFSEKIFQEPGLAKIDQEASRVINKKVRRARLALFIGLGIALGGLTWQRLSTGSRVERYGPLVQILKGYQDKAKYGGSSLPEAESGVGALEALASIQVQRLEVPPVPTSYFVGDLTVQANRAVAHVLGDGVGRPLRVEMERKGDALLPVSLETELPGDSRAQADEAAATGQLATKTPAEHLAQLRRFADDIITLHLNVKRYNNHDSRDLGQVYLYLTGKDITKTLESTAEWYRAALRDISGWPTLSWPRYGNRARTRALQLFDVMQAQLFRAHPLRAALTKLVELIDTIESRKGRESHYQRLKAIYDAVGAVESLIEDDKAAWLLNESFDPGPRYAELIEALNTDTFPAVGDSKAGQETVKLGKHLDAENQKQFKSLREFVWASKSQLGRFHLLDRREGKVVLSAELNAVQRALKEFIEQPYVIEDETQFQLDLQRDAGSRAEWNGDLIAMVLNWSKGFVAYLGGQRPAVPTAINTALDAAARKEFRARVLLVMRFAAPESLRLGEAGAEGSVAWTAARRDSLKARVRNLAEHYVSILKITKQLAAVSAALSEPVDAQVFNALRDDGLDLLNKANGILAQEKLYTIRSDDFSWWEGDQPPGVVAFGARDPNDLVARLAVQRKAITTLANEFARPLVDVMMALGEPFSTDPDVEKWKKIIAVLTDYEKKVPGNSLEDLERFIEADLNKLQLSSCQEQLERHIDRFNRSDFFKKQKYEIGTAMSSRCEQILRTVTLQGYVKLAGFFRDRLAGRFPYSSPDILAEVETADIVEFYKRFDRYAGAFKTLAKRGASGGRLFGKNTPEVLRFLQQVQRVRQMFTGLMQSEDDKPDLTLDIEFDFRVNRDNEVNGNQIIQWTGQVADERIEHRDNKRSTQWKTNDPVSICFRWAKDAMFLPSSNQRSEEARVNGRTACYAYTGRWALMRLLVSHAATPADRGRRSFLRPHTLRFETETTLASAARSANSLLVTDTRVYVRVTVMTPGGKSAFRVPEFPRRAPDLPVEFLKSNGIVTDGGEGGY